MQECEIFALNPDFDIERYKPLLDIATRLGGKKLICTCQDPDLARTKSNLGSLAELAQTHNLEVNVEFVPAYYVKSLEDAMQLVDGVQGVPGIVLDVMHFVRSHSSLEALEAAAQKVRVAHLCDVQSLESPETSEELANEMRSTRLAPGLGAIELRAILSRLKEDTVIAVEVPDREAAKIQTALQRARFYLETTEKLLKEMELS